MPKVPRIALTVSLSAVVLALGGGQALANHVSCGDVLTEDTTLDRDLVGCTGDGLVIGADGVTLDLNDHTISGTGSPGSVGVRNRGFDRARIRGGEINKFETGVLLDEASENRVHTLFAVGIEHGILLDDSEDNQIDRNSARSEIGDDSRCEERAGIALFDSHQNLVEDNVTEVTEFGILLDDSHRNRIVRNESSPEGSDGNVCDGISLEDSDANQIIENVTAEGDDGANGIRVGSGCRDTHIERNRAFHNSDDGIDIEPGSPGTRIERNDAHRNLDDGIDVHELATTIAQNVVNENEDLGIEAISGVIDGGGNSASGNADPRLCIGVVCIP